MPNQEARKRLPNMDVAQAICTLQAFNQRVDRMKTYTLAQKFMRGGHIEYSLNEPADEKIAGLLPEQVDAFMLSLRLFYQEHDAISFSRISQIYNTLPVGSEQQQAHNTASRTWNRFLSTKSMYQVGGVERSHRAYLDTFLFGNLAHYRYKDKVTFTEAYEQLQENPLSAMFAHVAFNQVLHRFFKVLLEMYRVNEEAIGNLGAASDDGLERLPTGLNGGLA